VDANGVQNGPFTLESTLDGTRMRLDGTSRNGKSHGLVYLRMTSKKSVSVEVGHYRDGDRVGEHHLYLNGKLFETKVYSLKSKMTRTINYYPNGRKETDARLATGRQGFEELHGAMTQWWSNGRKARQGRFARGKRVGKWRQWNRRGKPVSSKVFDKLWEKRLHHPNP
jgi:antitoxin component YwqK of YwqJK toxin-antitoxin module